MNPSLPDLEGDVIKGKNRTFYSVRIIALCAAVAALVAALISVPVVLILSNDASDRSYRADVKACENRNSGKSDLNARLVTQRQDATNLGLLASTMSEVRKSEAKAFDAIAKAFKIEEEVNPLINVLNNASVTDRRIATEQAQVKFKDAVPQACNNPDVVPKP